MNQQTAHVLGGETEISRYILEYNLRILNASLLV